MVRGGRPKRRPQREMPSGSGPERTGRKLLKVRDARPEEQTGSRPRLPLWKMLIPGQLDKAVEEAQRESDRLKLEVERLRRENAEAMQRQNKKNPRYLQPLGDESGPNSPQAIQKQPAPGPRPPSSRKSSSRRVKLFNRPV